MVDSHAATFAAEVYKAYLHCAAKVVSSEGGEITAYDGDRLMAVYIGDRKNTSAVRSALKLNYAVDEIINPLLRAQYPNTSFCLKHCVGVDTSSLFVARTGIRGSNDLVWVGRAANHAAKMTSLTGLPAWISEDVYDHMNDAVKMSQKGEAMWTKRLWTAMAQKPVYASSWRWGGL
jgi:class 3 adenylate cyclase